MSLTMANDLGQRAEPFLLTSTSLGSVSERDLASSKRHSLSPDKSLRGMQGRRTRYGHYGIDRSTFFQGKKIVCPESSLLFNAVKKQSDYEVVPRDIVYLQRDCGSTSSPVSCSDLPFFVRML